jgi:pimeloyl-ACP methyl ester carboxylesterase
MATFVLIHGAFHGAWCWERVTPLFQAKGHRVFAPDMPGQGDDDADLRTVTLDDYMTRIGVVLSQVEEPAILVGHSLGGISITQAGEIYTGQIAKLVYLTAFIPANGESRASMQIAQSPPASAGSREVSADGTSMSFKDEAIGPIFYNDCDEETLTWVKTRLKPQATAISNAPVQTTAEKWGSIPRAFIACTLDQAIPLEQQQACWERYPCDPVITMETSHSPFMSQPEALAGHLDDIADGI